MANKSRSKKYLQQQLIGAVAALDKLEMAEGSLNKEAILEQHRDNLVLKTIIKMAIGTDRYFVRPSMNLVCTSTVSPLQSWQEFEELTSKLKNRELTGTAAKTATNRFLARCEPRLMQWYCRILNHDLRIGVGKLTIDKVWNSEFLLADSAKHDNWRFHGCALAKKYEDVYREARKGVIRPTFPQALEIKFDGERALLICFPRENEVYVFTRSGRRREKIEQVDEFCTEVIDFCRTLNHNQDADPDRPLFLDGEFLANKWNDTSSIVRKTKNFSEEEFLREVKVYLWDWSPLDSYLEGKFKMKWVRRKSDLLFAAGAERPTKESVVFQGRVVVVGHLLIYNEGQLFREFGALLDQNHEGGVLKDINAPHVFKRCKYLVKLKPEDEITGRIVDVKPGEDANAAVIPSVKGRVRNAMLRVGKIKQTEAQFFCKTESADALIEEIKKIVRGDNEYRISQPRQDVVGFRHGQRLGYLVVELSDGQKVHVGGGFKTKAGNDERSLFWKNRDKLIGMYVDFKQQAGSTVDAVSRYPNFVRLREDLS